MFIYPVILKTSSGHKEKESEEKERGKKNSQNIKRVKEYAGDKRGVLVRGKTGIPQHHYPMRGLHKTTRTVTASWYQYNHQIVPTRPKLIELTIRTNPFLLPAYTKSRTMLNPLVLL